MRRRAACAALVLLAAGALAADASLDVRGLGKANVRWNSLRFRQALLEQLQPGLTWRLGKDSATRLEIEKMALVAEDTILLPGTVALNVRYWSMRRWELVAFELTPDIEGWKWNEDKAQFGLLPARMGSYAEEKAIVKSLELSFVRNTKGNRTDVPRPAITGGHGNLAEIWEVPDDVEYEPDLRARWEALEMVEFTVRFGPHVVIADFEPAAVATLRGERSDAEGAKTEIEIRYVQLPEPDLRRAFLEEFDGAVPFGVVTQGHSSGEPVLLSVSGGDVPYLWVKSRNGQEDIGEPIEGERHDATTPGEEPQKPKKPRKPRKKKKPRKGARATVTAQLDGATLTIEMAATTYVFDLSRNF